jgi:hypothetical protein
MLPNPDQLLYLLRLAFVCAQNRVVRNSWNRGMKHRLERCHALASNSNADFSPKIRPSNKSSLDFGAANILLQEML